MKVNKPLLSIVVPVYFEELVLNEMYDRLKKVLVQLESQYNHEIIFINDGSTDKSIDTLLQISAHDNIVKVLDFSRNFGHQIAVSAGLDYAKGAAAIVIDADLQDPPEVIVQMLEKWREGYQVVYGVRTKRKGENALKLLTAKIFYRILEKLSDTKLPLDAGDFRLVSREVIDALKSMPEGSRYIRGMVTWVGFKQCGVSYERDARYAGETKYTLKKMLAFAIDGITSFSDKPLRLTMHFGLFVTFLAFLALAWIIINKAINPASGIQGWTSLISIVLFLGGVQLISIGILGEYVGRVFKETKRRPLYVIANKYGFDSAYELKHKVKEKDLILNGIKE